MTYIITNKSANGKTVYFDGFGFSLLRANAKEMTAAEGVTVRSAICWQYESCRLVKA